MAGRITKKGARLAIITMGEKGSVMRTEDSQLFHQRAHCVQVVDTTGCGDVYHGAFLAAYVRGYELEKMMEWATAAAAMKATRLGARSYIPKCEQIEAFLTSRH